MKEPINPILEKRKDFIEKKLADAQVENEQQYLKGYWDALHWMQRILRLNEDELKNYNDFIIDSESTGDGQ